jgi:hypothetical protein
LIPAPSAVDLFLTLIQLSRHIAQSQPKDLSARTHYAGRGPTSTCSLRRVLRAQERAAAKRKEETLAFRQGWAYENADEQILHKQAGYALNAARSILETIITEKKVAASIIDEAEDHLQSTHSMNIAVEERLSLVEEQLGTIMEAAHWIGFSLALPLDEDIQGCS